MTSPPLIAIWTSASGAANPVIRTADPSSCTAVDATLTGAGVAVAVAVDTGVDVSVAVLVAVGDAVLVDVAIGVTVGVAVGRGTITT
jgi:hypothetical protein